MVAIKDVTTTPEMPRMVRFIGNKSLILGRRANLARHTATVYRSQTLGQEAPMGNVHQLALPLECDLHAVVAHCLSGEELSALAGVSRQLLAAVEEAACTVCQARGRSRAGKRPWRRVLAHMSDGARMEATVEGHGDNLRCVLPLPNGNVVTGSYDTALIVWGCNAGDEWVQLAVLAAHTDAVTCMAALANGTLVSGGRDRSLRVWDYSSAECTAHFTGHTGTGRETPAPDPISPRVCFGSPLQGQSIASST
jgi:WD40 repeat protein